jgi:hypothetical protein
MYGCYSKRTYDFMVVTPHYTQFLLYVTIGKLTHMTLWGTHVKEDYQVSSTAKTTQPP